MLSFPRACKVLCLSMLLAACVSAPGPVPPVTAASVEVSAEVSAPKPADGPVYRIDGAASAVRIFVFRGGKAQRLGHNHVLAVPNVTGYVQVPAENGEGARFELSFRLDAMQVDPPELRQALGAGWASAVSPEAVAGTRANMLGEAGLQAARFPRVRIRSLSLSGEAPKLAAQVEVELHGQRRELWVPLDVSIKPEQVTASGALVIRQSEFGVMPFSVLGGLLAVKDELVVEFRLVAKPEKS